MVKKAVIGAAGILVIAVVIQINTISNIQEEIVVPEKQFVASENETIIIEYDEASLESREESNVTIIDKDKDFIEAKTYDSLGRIEIVLINYDKKEKLNKKDTVTLYGKIDYSKFKLKIPRELVYKDEGNLFLRVINVQSGEEDMVAFEYIDMLRDEEQDHFIKINSNDMNRVEYYSKDKGVLP